MSGAQEPLRLYGRIRKLAEDWGAEEHRKVWTKLHPNDRRSEDLMVAAHIEEQLLALTQAVTALTDVLKEGFANGSPIVKALWSTRGAVARSEEGG